MAKQGKFIKQVLATRKWPYEQFENKYLSNTVNFSTKVEHIHFAETATLLAELREHMLGTAAHDYIRPFQVNLRFCFHTEMQGSEYKLSVWISLWLWNKKGIWLKMWTLLRTLRLIVFQTCQLYQGSLKVFSSYIQLSFIQRVFHFCCK